MFFSFKWIHGDGSTIEFSPEGWHSDDRTKIDWLNEESGQSNCWPVIPSLIRAWLQRNCELIEFRGVIPDVHAAPVLTN
jgi:hypothetical protein